METVVSFKDAYRAGIRRDFRNAANSQALVTCRNLRPTQWGLKDHLPITNPFSAVTLENAGIIPSWPFPQLFRGKKVTLLADATAIFLVDESDWSLTPIDTYTIYNTDAASQALDITEGGPWHFMDFHDTWMLFNGACQVFKTGYSPKTFVQNAVTIRTGCELLEGRALMAGFDRDNYRTQAWRDYLATYMDNIPKAYQQDLSIGADGNWLWWSSIGGADLMHLFRLDAAITSTMALIRNGSFSTASGWTLATGWTISAGALHGSTVTGTAEQSDLFVPVKTGATYRVRFTNTISAGSLNVSVGGVLSSAIITAGSQDVAIVAGADGTMKIHGTGFTGTVTNLQVNEENGFRTEHPYFFDLLERNESGLAPMPYQYPVQQILPIGKNVVLYGTGGIMAATPQAVNSYHHPVNTFGLVDINDLWRGVGVPGRACAGGGSKGHVFIDQSGELWSISPDLKAEKLGYGEIFNPMLGGVPVISYDPQYEHFIIADGQEGYCLSQGGLSKIPTMPTTVGFTQGGAVGITFDDTDPDSVDVLTDTFTGPEVGRHAELSQIRVVAPDVKIEESCASGDFSDAEAWNVGANWTIENGTLSHTSGSTAQTTQTLGQQNYPVYVGRSYWVSYDVFLYSGSVTVGLGVTTGEPRSVSGSYIEEILAVTNGIIKVIPTTDFVGYITNLSIREKYEGWTAYVDSKQKAQDDWQRTFDIPVGDKDVIDLLVGGTEFRVGLKAPYRDRVALEQMDVTVRTATKRNSLNTRYGRNGIAITPLGTSVCPVGRVVYISHSVNAFYLCNPDSAQLWANDTLVWNLVYRSDLPDKNGLYTAFVQKTGTITGTGTAAPIEVADLDTWYVTVNGERRMKIDLAAHELTWLWDDGAAVNTSDSSTPAVITTGATCFQVCDSAVGAPATAMSLQDDGGLRLLVPFKQKLTQAECLLF